MAVAFPGGMADETDRDPIHTALRETEEEIGVSSERLSLIGTHHEVPSKTGAIVTPVLAFIDEQRNYAADELLRTLTLSREEIGTSFSLITVINNRAHLTTQNWSLQWQ